MGGEDTPYPHWAELLDACEDFAALSGWRFILSDFMRMEAADGSVGTPRVAAAMAQAMPTALHYADQVAVLTRASMVATCRALGLLPSPPSRTPDGGPPPAPPLPVGGADRQTADSQMDYQDTTQPLTVIASRLANHAKVRFCLSICRQQKIITCKTRHSCPD
ncbi:hypothetical protein T492DRAFT_23224 [Pavlovales sp. CCMP2436]|nr:hypothetical protein T492DRAFT_23224 [Pavlovales sp. CCMP2436]